VSLSSRDQQMEQDRAPAVFLSYWSFFVSFMHHERWISLLPM
jgi:hypothetical protein